MPGQKSQPITSVKMICRFLARLPAVPDFLEEFAPTAAAAAAARPGARPTGRPAAAVPGISLAGIASEVSSAVSAVVGRQLQQEASLMESGLDSLGAVELRNSLAASFDIELPATLVRPSCCVAWCIHCSTSVLQQNAGASAGLRWLRIMPLDIPLRQNAAAARHVASASFHAGLYVAA